jgi:hypothetical protein
VRCDLAKSNFDKRGLVQATNVLEQTVIGTTWIDQPVVRRGLHRLVPVQINFDSIGNAVSLAIVLQGFHNTCDAYNLAGLFQAPDQSPNLTQLDNDESLVVYKVWSNPGTASPLSVATKVWMATCNFLLGNTRADAFGHGLT